jgi:hypothetical protein
MKLYEFNLLDINNQMETVNQQGVYLDNYITKSKKFNLYAINMFFVEVCYNSLENKISGIKSFKSGHLLNRYSNIDSLFN